nr:NADH dehydrogenase subunit 2 [Perittopus sp. HL-2012]
MKSSTKMTMLTTLALSSIMIISSENWLNMWMGLEINMMSFIPMLQENNKTNSSQSKMMYFLVQSMSSIMFLFTIIINPMMMYSNMKNEIIMTIITISMCMKLGMAPIHMWFISMINKISWNNCLMLMTWQKMAPMYILTNTLNNIKIISIMAVMSAMTGAIGGINQTSIKKIMAFSSINHMSWMLICLSYDNEMWMKYLIIYSMIIIIMIQVFKKNSTLYINQMNMNYKTNMEKISMIILFLSLGGLPPFIGFLPKWIVIESLIKTNSTMILTILIMSSMITLYYYMRMISPTIMSQSTTNKWNFKKNKMNNTHMMNMMLNLTLPLTMIMNML